MTFEDIDPDIRACYPTKAACLAEVQVAMQVATQQVVDNPLVDEAREYWGDLAKTKAKMPDH